MFHQAGKWIKAVGIWACFASMPLSRVLAASGAAEQQTGPQWGALLVVALVFAMLGGLLVAMGMLADRLAEDEQSESRSQA